MNDLQDYCDNYLRVWDKQATVRGFEHFDLATRPESLERLPLKMSALVTQPILASRGEATQQRYLLQYSLGFLHSIATTETEVVSRVSTRVANKHGLFNLPFNVRQVLLSIATDEVYHSYMAWHYIEQIRQLTGETYALAAEQAGYERGAALLKNELPRAVAERLDILLVCLIENSITQELVDLHKSIEQFNPIHRIVSEHLIDEGRHSGFFARLLGICWQQLEPEERSAFAEILPRYLEEVYTDSPAFRDGLVTMLRWIGVPEDEALALRDTVPAIDRQTIPVWQNNRRALEQAQVLDDAAVHDSLRDAGWLSG